VPFGRTPPWSIGVEDELMLVDERTYELVPAAAQLFGRGRRPRPCSPRANLRSPCAELISRS
jgi:hypothetical protein